MRAAGTRCVPVGHRGDPYVCRENTLPSIRSAVGAGAGAVEIDVRLTRDGVPVLLHDATLKRLWGRDRPLSGLTADEVRQLTRGGVPTLREALACVSSTRLLIDLPDASAAPAAVAQVRESGAGDRVYYCGALAALHAVRRAEPTAEIALTWTTLAPCGPGAAGRAAPPVAQLPLRAGLPGAGRPLSRRRAAGLRLDRRHPAIDGPAAEGGRRRDHHQPGRRPGGPSAQRLISD